MAEPVGKVWLVGAGPSDAGLMTLRGCELLKQADTVVYDHLLGYGVLSMIPPAAKKIDVGKLPGRHPVSQGEINRILVEEARMGGRVVRLKGGDPFLFGRGAEELETLREHGIPCEVVPGVTSALAVPEYAGIPVTHREYSSSVHIFSGHHSEENQTALDFSAAVKLGGTLVFLMGVSSAERICRALMEAGMPESTPAAAVESGTTPRQKTVSATLGTLADAAAAQNVRPPAVLVIGRTAALTDRLAWADRRPLDGRRVVVTRPLARCGEFCAKIRALGGEAAAFPCIETVPLPGSLSEALKRLNRFTWIAFSSAAGADAFFSALRGAGRDTRALGSAKIAAVGSATARRLASYGVVPDLVPEEFNGLSLGKALARKAGAEDRVLVVRARFGSGALEEQLARSGVPFESSAAYETRPAREETVPEIRKMIESGEFDFITFASASAVRGAVRAFPNLDFSLVGAVCIGPETAAEAEKYGMRPAVARVSTTDGMLEAMIHLRRPPAAGDRLAKTVGTKKGE